MSTHESTRTSTARWLVIFAVAWLGAGCGDCCSGDATRTDGSETPAGDGSTSADPVVVQVRQLIEQERYEEALRAMPSDRDPEIEALRGQAAMERSARDHLRLACMITDGIDLEAVHEACLEIAPESRYHDRGCCRGASVRYGEARLRAVTSIAEADGPEHARAAALDVADDDTMPTSLREQARQLVADFESQPDASPDSGPVRRAGARGTSKRRSDEGLAPVEEGFAARAVQNARTALSQGNPQGCISALRSVPRNDQVVSLLINCYARAGDLQAAGAEAHRSRDLEYAERFRTERCR